VTHNCATDGHPEGANFYVTVMRDDGKAVALSGPYKTHEEALAMVDTARRWAWDVDPRGPWYSYGTAALDADYTAPGIYERHTSAPFGPGPECHCPDGDGAEHLAECAEAS
jgi:hypothetical protein